jgi:hypothetical protein
LQQDLHAIYPDGMIVRTLRGSAANHALLFFELREYRKFRSVIAIAGSRLPILDAMLLCRWTRQAEEQFEWFVRQHNVKNVLLRSDRPGGRLGSPSAQGVDVNAVSKRVNQFLMKTNDTVVAIQLAGDVFHNLYNLNIGLGFKPLRVVIEVAGPGFTAQDLNRFGIVHERIELPIHAMDISANLVERKYLISREEYKRQRNQKIHTYDTQQLEKVDATILTAVTYEPIPLSCIRTVWSELKLIRMATEWLDLSDQAIVSASFLARADVVDHFYWDIHPSGY